VFELAREVPGALGTVTVARGRGPPPSTKLGSPFLSSRIMVMHQVLCYGLERMNGTENNLRIQ
jgi:hypothetical protein